MRHCFPFLLNNADRLPVFLSGAGLSWGLIPMPAEIIRQRRASAEAQLNANYGQAFAPTTGDPEGLSNDTLYSWAEEAIAFLTSAGVQCPKLVLARLLHLTTDPRWLAGVSVEVSTLKPRHRVVARFAREGRWRALWTFNWDCHIEAALRAVGIKELPPDTNQPWIVRCQRFLSIEDYGAAPAHRTVQIHKPHGCVQSLVDAEAQIAQKSKTEADFANLKFKITKSELCSAPDPITPDYVAFRTLLLDHFRANPNVAIGWSASEQYMLDELDAIHDQLREYPDPQTRLSIVDPKFNNDGHVRLTQIYNVTKNESYFPVESADSPSVDTLLRWIQANYTLEVILKFLSPGAIRDRLEQWAVNLRGGQTPKWLLDWADFLVPAWVRLCWREGLVEARSLSGDPLEPDEVRLEGDWHVPLAQSLPHRPELMAMANIFFALSENSATWVFDKFPGFVSTASDQAILLVPVWGNPARRRWLSSLKPLLHSLRSRSAIYSEICVLAIGGDREATTAENEEAYNAVQNLSKTLSLVRGRNLRKVTIDQLSGASI